MSTLRVAKRDGNDEEGEDATREEGRWEMQGSELEEEEAAGGRVATRRGCQAFL